MNAINITLLTPRHTKYAKTTAHEISAAREPIDIVKNGKYASNRINMPSLEVDTI